MTEYQHFTATRPMTETEANAWMDSIMASWRPGDPMPSFRIPYGNDLPCMHSFGEVCDCASKRPRPESAASCDCGGWMEDTGTMSTCDPRPVLVCTSCNAVKVAGPEPSAEILQRRVDVWSTTRGVAFGD